MSNVALSMRNEQLFQVVMSNLNNPRVAGVRIWVTLIFLSKTLITVCKHPRTLRPRMLDSASTQHPMHCFHRMSSLYITRRLSPGFFNGQ
jgi:hypothetical protein